MTGREERWLPVPDWVGVYEVSDAGRVRSVDRVASDGRRVGGHLLTPRPTRRGYLVVNLGSGRARHTVLVHRLVMLAFKPGGARRWPQVRHDNGDRTANDLGNLRWGDQPLNEQDKTRQRKRRGNKGSYEEGLGISRKGVTGRTSRVSPLGTAGTPASTALSRDVPGLTNGGSAVSPAHVPGTQGDLGHDHGYRESPCTP